MLKSLDTSSTGNRYMFSEVTLRANKTHWVVPDLISLSAGIFIWPLSKSNSTNLLLSGPLLQLSNPPGFISSWCRQEPLWKGGRHPYRFLAYFFRRSYANSSIGLLSSLLFASLGPCISAVLVMEYDFYRLSYGYLVYALMIVHLKGVRNQGIALRRARVGTWWELLRLRTHRIMYWSVIGLVEIAVHVLSPLVTSRCPAVHRQRLIMLYSLRQSAELPFGSVVDRHSCYWGVRVAISRLSGPKGLATRSSCSELSVLTAVRYSPLSRWSFVTDVGGVSSFRGLHWPGRDVVFRQESSLGLSSLGTQGDRVEPWARRRVRLGADYAEKRSETSEILRLIFPIPSKTFHKSARLKKWNLAEQLNSSIAYAPPYFHTVNNLCII